MPDKGHTPKQARLMMAVAHGFRPTRLKGGGPSVAVAKEYVAEKKGTALLSKAARGAPRSRALRRRAGGYGK